MPDKSIGHYKVTDKLLGQGSFSKVFLGYALNNKVAVKVIERQNIKERQLTRFQQQIQLLKQCKSKFVVDCYDIKKTKNNFYIFLQYCEGGDLGKYISAHKRIAEFEAMPLFFQLLRGMISLRNMKIIHRDLKPANLMLENGNLKIIDFGLARKYSQGEMIQTFAGTPFNMAPEILKGLNYDEKVDVYSAGTVLYEMLYGVVPFEAKDFSGLKKQIESGKLNQIQTNVSAEVKQLLKKMLQPQPSKRICFTELIEFMQNYENSLKKKRLQIYRQQSQRCLEKMGLFGGLIYPFDFVNWNVNPNLDLKLCHKLYHKLVPIESN